MRIQESIEGDKGAQGSNCTRVVSSKQLHQYQI